MHLSFAIMYSWCNFFVGGKDWGEEILVRDLQQENCNSTMVQCKCIKIICIFREINFYRNIEICELQNYRLPSGRIYRIQKIKRNR